MSPNRQKALVVVDEKKEKRYGCPLLPGVGGRIVFASPDGLRYLFTTIGLGRIFVPKELFAPARWVVIGDVR